MVAILLGEGSRGGAGSHGGHRVPKGARADQASSGVHLCPLPDSSAEGEGAPIVVASGDHQPDHGVLLSHLEGAAHATDGRGRQRGLPRGGHRPSTSHPSCGPSTHRDGLKAPGPPSAVE